MQLIRNQSGMTMISVVISALIGSFVVLSIATGISQVYQAQRSAVLGFSAGTTMTNLRLTIDMPQACDAAFDNFSFDPVNERSLSGIQIDAGGVLSTLTEDTELEPGLTLKKLAIVPNRQVAPKTVRVNGVDYDKYLAYVVVETEKTHSNIGKSSPPTYIPISVVVDQGGGVRPIRNCGATSVAQEVCTASQGVWDPTKPIGQQCRPAGGCKYGGSFGDAPINRGGYVNEFTNAMSCPNGYSQQRSGAITYTTQCGKKCVQNTYYPTYECIVCKNADGTDMALLDAIGSITTDDPVGYDDAEETDTENRFGGNQTLIGNLADTTNTTVSPTPSPLPTRPPCDGSTNGTTWGCYYCICLPPEYGGGCNWVFTCESDPTNPSCFTAGTQVRMGDGSTKAIEEIQKGEEVLSYDEVNHETRIAKIIEPVHHKSSKQKLLHVTLADGRKFTTNDIHPIFIAEYNDWVQMKQIFALQAMGVQLSMLSADGTTIAIESIDVSIEYVPMYNLHVVGIAPRSNEFGIYGQGHTYFVEDILVHNAVSEVKPDIQ